MQTEEAPRDVLERLAQEREPLYKEVADFTVRTDEQSAKVVANQIIEKLDF
uniref:shikimate kinase n=1 Tax=Streptomyces galilaeus TaxID=33899 RepID=UPI0038F8154D